MMPRESHYPEITGPLSDLLRSESLELFGIAGAVDAADDSVEAQSEYNQWISAGHHGEMEYLSRHAGMKYQPGRVLTGCRSVIVVGMNYYQAAAGDHAATDHAAGDHAAPAPAGRVARYAWGRDYHNALGKRLKRVVQTLRAGNPGHQFRSFVDASPLSERFFASRAGIGFTAKNTLTISGAYGSWFFLGEILSTLEYPQTPSPEGAHGGCPRGCFRCGKACPTGALYAADRIDARRCISYLTIEYRGSIPVELRPLMGDWIFGCDLCQEVCPLNLHVRVTEATDFLAHRAGGRIRLDEILAIDTDENYRARFSGTPLLRPGRPAMIRNAAIAAANTQAVQLLPRLRTLANDNNGVIREHARWAIDRMNG
jgi:epoxyqueuosine reductase